MLKSSDPRLGFGFRSRFGCRGRSSGAVGDVSPGFGGMDHRRRSWNPLGIEMNPECFGAAGASAVLWSRMSDAELRSR